MKGRKIKYEQIHGIKSKKGIYILKNESEIVYIGKSISLRDRLLNHWGQKLFDEIEILLIENEADINIIEPYLVSVYKPCLNKDFITKEKSSFVLDFEKCIKSKEIIKSIN